MARWDLLHPFLFFVSLVHGLDNGLARTPQLGWNSYNAYSCDATEADYRAQAAAVVQHGLDKAGYEYFNIDCGWQSTNRTPSGEITWNATRFPSGIPDLSSYVRSLGLKFGVYSDAGYYSCDFVGGTAHWVGSLGHEKQDAATFAGWNASYLKYDNCYSVNRTDFVDYYPPPGLTQQHYARMRNALAEVANSSLLFSICEWGVDDPARWPASSYGNSWRISNDIGPPPSWDNLIRIINQVVPITGFAGPGAWNDLDLLEVGNDGLTTEEQRTHFAFWAMAKSPLLVSTDLTAPANETLAILKNQNILAVNQDSLGRSIAFKRRYTSDSDVWAGPLADDQMAAIVINWKNETRNLTLHFSDVGLKAAAVEDLWSQKKTDLLHGSYSANVGPHGALALRLSQTAAAPSTNFTYYGAASTSNKFSGGAKLRTVNGSVAVASDIGFNGSFAFGDVDGGNTGGSKLLSLEWIQANETFQNTACSNCRNVFISVNGGEAQEANFPLSGQSWNISFRGYLLEAGGFRPGKNNTVSFANPTDWAPDIVRLGVA